jgi:hypothetical protein
MSSPCGRKSLSASTAMRNREGFAGAISIFI